MSKRAAIDISGVILAWGTLSVFDDAGLAIVGSLACPQERFVRLVIEGAALPDDCARAGSLKLVTASFTAEVYGKQRITRLGDITIVGDA